MISERVLVALALIAAAAAVGALALLHGRRRPEKLAPTGPGSRGVRALCPSQVICTALHTWLMELEGLADAWVAFDQRVRELLSVGLGAGRVRCYRVVPGEDTLQTFAASGREAQGPSARAGVLGYVVTTGREYVAADAAHGPLVDDLAAATDERWEWVWPVRERQLTIGVVAVAQVANREALTAELREAVGQAVSVGWRYVATLEQLELLRRIDPGSGVLKRNEFFALARHALDDSYRGHEPVVMAALAVEGLRGLDDTGRWQDRDRLVEQVGLAIRRRVRSDDLVGRFADDRFVILMRRLDSGLGRLICGKIIAAGGEALRAVAGDAEGVELRAGLSGSGLRRPGLEALLAAAFEAVERARRADRALVSDVD